MSILMSTKEQVKNTQNIRNKIVTWAENSLQPLIDDGLVSEIVVSAIQDNVRGIKLSIQLIVRAGDVVKLDFWLNTDLGNLTDAN